MEEFRVHQENKKLEMEKKTKGKDLERKPTGHPMTNLSERETDSQQKVPENKQGLSHETSPEKSELSSIVSATFQGSRCNTRATKNANKIKINSPDFDPSSSTPEKYKNTLNVIIPEPNPQINSQVIQIKTQPENKSKNKNNQDILTTNWIEMVDKEQLDEYNSKYYSDDDKSQSERSENSRIPQIGLKYWKI